MHLIYRHVLHTVETAQGDEGEEGNPNLTLTDASLWAGHLSSHPHGPYLHGRRYHDHLRFTERGDRGTDTAGNFPDIPQPRKGSKSTSPPPGHGPLQVFPEAYQ